MRTTIYLTGMMISDAIRNSSTLDGFYGEDTVTLIVTFFFVFVFMDIIDWMKQIVK